MQLFVVCIHDILAAPLHVEIQECLPPSGQSQRQQVHTWRTNVGHHIIFTSFHSTSDYKLNLKLTQIREMERKIERKIKKGNKSMYNPFYLFSILRKI